MTTITIPTPSAAGVKRVLTTQAFAGYRTYIVLLAGMAVIAANHFGLLPEEMAKQLALDPKNWINDEYALLLGGTGRAAIASLKASVEKLSALAGAAPTDSVPAAPPPAPGGTAG